MSSVLQQKARISSNREVAGGVFQMEIHSPWLVSSGLPGQFVSLRVGDGLVPLLRRPLSIFMTDSEAGSVGLLFRVVGRGTELLSRMKAGELLDLIGPLGRGFSVSSETKKVFIAAGGLGVAPLFFLAQVLLGRGVSVQFLLGAKEEGQLLCCDELRAMGVELHISTDDGSRGFHGFVTELLEEMLGKDGLDPQTPAICATGPEAMMKRIAALAREQEIPAQFSLERHMACGMGACLGCVMRCRSEDGGPVYRRVCADGPVFDLEEIPWDS